MSDYSTDKYEISVLADRIYCLKPAEGAEINVADVKEMRAKYLELSGGRTFAILLDATGNFTVDQEANALLASKEFAELRKAAAFVTPGLANRLVGNFFIRFHKPASATKLFNDEGTALEWLKEQMKACP